MKASQAFAAVLVLALAAAAWLWPPDFLWHTATQDAASPRSVDKRPSEPVGDDLRTPLPSADAKEETLGRLRDPRPEPADRMSRSDWSDPAPVEADSGADRP
jgi:hypothetical protein